MNKKETPELELSVITVTYNERGNITLFIETVNRIFAAHQIKGEIVVVDDNSPDGTSQVVTELKATYPHTTLLTRPGKMGIGSAYYDGLKLAQGKVVAFLDADLSHSPDNLPEFLTEAQQGQIVFGSRYIDKTKFETDFAHRLGTKLLNGWVSFILETGMKDHTNGYVVAPRDTLERIIAYGKPKGLFPFDHILYGITIAALAKKLNIPVVERRAHYHQRTHGETKIPFLWGIEVVVGDMWYALRVRLKR